MEGDQFVAGMIGKLPAKDIIACLETIVKLVQNIISNPYENKYRMINPNNKVMKSTLFNIPDIDRLLILIGYQFDGENYYVSDEMLGVLLDEQPYLNIRKKLLQAQLISNYQYEKELQIAQNQVMVLRKKRKQTEEQERLTNLARNDARQRKHMKADTTSKSSYIGFTEGSSKTWKDVGVNLCKPGR